MTVNEFLDEFDNLSGPRKFEGLKKLFETILYNMGNHEITILDILDTCANAEDMYEFGTEGMDI